MKCLIAAMLFCGIAMAQGSTPESKVAPPVPASPPLTGHIPLPDKLLAAYWKAHAAALLAQSTEQSQITAMQLECAKQKADLLQDQQSGELYCQASPVTIPKEAK